MTPVATRDPRSMTTEEKLERALTRLEFVTARAEKILARMDSTFTPPSTTNPEGEKD